MNKSIGFRAHWLGAVSGLLVMSTLAFCKKPATNLYLDAAAQAAAWIRAGEVRGPDGRVLAVGPVRPQDRHSTSTAAFPASSFSSFRPFIRPATCPISRTPAAGADYLLAKMPGVKGPGLYEGLSGIAFALEETYKAAKEEKYRRGFLDCLETDPVECQPGRKRGRVELDDGHHQRRRRHGPLPDLCLP